MASGARSTKEILDDLCRDIDEPSQLATKLLAIVERIDLSRGIIAIATQFGPSVNLRPLEAIHFVTALAIPQSIELVTYNQRLTDACQQSSITVLAPA